jgi:TonB-linked SusC/RagA family outer membrane protein
MPLRLTATVHQLWLTVCLFLFSAVAMAQQRTITGKVTNTADNAPVAGATITVKGTNIATQTDADGNFSLSVPNNSNTLVITYVGFESQEVAIGNQSSITVGLRSSASQLSEVVVTGYTAQRRKDITGSVAVVDVGNMRQIPTGNASQALQGQASGVTVLSSGQPGAGTSIRVRGITSTGSSAPLVIIDGTPGDLTNLNVNDIESIQVLKDAGAAAIYGVRGSNGVVVVTTKRGRAGKVRVNYDGYYGTQIPVKGGENPFNIANTLETATAVQQSYINSGLTPGNKQYGTGATPVIPDYINPFATMEGDPRVNPDNYALYDNQITRANKVGTDWFNEIFDAAPIQSHNISLGAASDRSNFFLSLNYFDQEGTLLNTYLKRYSARINTTFNIADRIRIGENLYAFYRQSPGFTNQNEGNAISHSYRQSVIIPVYDIMGNFAGTLSQNLGNAQNPVAIMARTADNKGNNYQITGNVFAEVDVIPQLTARTSFGGTIDNNYYNFFSFTQYENAENNRNPNAFQEGFGYNSNWTWTNTLTYTQIFGEHNLKVLGGSEAIRNYGRGINGRRGNYYITNPNNLTVDPSLWTLNFGSPSGQTNANDFGPYENALYSLFGRVDYNFADKYLVSATVRRDGSSVFAEENRFGVFPSVTGGWRISREAFFPTVNWLNELKLRGGWGKLGSISNINPTNFYDLYAQAAAQSFYDIGGSNTGSALGVYYSQIGNQQTTWEEDIITNIGLDASLFNNKLDFSIEWYKKAISGLLIRRLADPVVQGPTQPFVNSGNIENTGIDAQLTYRGAIATDWDFNITGTFTSYNNKVVSLPEGRKYIDQGSAGSTRIGSFSRMQPGEALGAFYGYEVIGLFQSAEDVSRSPVQEAAAPGRLKFRDVNGDGNISDADRTFFGNPNPDFTAGLNLGVNYKNFDFSTFLYASVGNDVINYVRYWTEFPSVFDGAISKEAVYNSWSPDRPNAKVPRLERAANFSTSTQFSSYYLEDGSFLKMRSLILGYTIPSAKLSRLGIDKFRIYLQGANLFTATKYTGLDPELVNSDLNNNTNFGIDFGNYPNNQKNYNIGVNLSF